MALPPLQLDMSAGMEMEMDGGFNASEIVELKQQVVVLCGKISELKGSLESKKVENGQLASALGRCFVDAEKRRVQLQQAQQTIQKMSANEEHVQALEHNLQVAIEDSMKQVALVRSKEQEVSDLTTQVKRISSDVSKLSSDLDSFQTRLEGSQTSIRALEEVLKRLESALDTQSKAELALRNQISQLQAQNQALNNDFSNFRLESAANSRATLAKAEEDKGLLRAEAENSVARAEQIREEHQKSISALKTEYETVLRAKRNLKNDLAQGQSRIEQAESDLLSLGEQHQRTQRELSNLQERLEAAVTALKDGKESHDVEIKRIRDEAEMTRNAHQGKLNAYMREVSYKDECLAELECEVHTLKQLVDTYLTENGALRKVCATKDEEKDALETKLHETVEALKQSKEELRSQRPDIRNSLASTGSMHSTRRRGEESNVSIRASMSSVGSKLKPWNQLQNELEATKIELEEANKTKFQAESREKFIKMELERFVTISQKEKDENNQHLMKQRKVNTDLHRLARDLASKVAGLEANLITSRGATTRRYYFIIVDDSGSMTGHSWVAAQRILNLVIDRIIELDSQAKVSINCHTNQVFRNLATVHSGMQSCLPAHPVGGEHWSSALDRTMEIFVREAPDHISSPNSSSCVCKICKSGTVRYILIGDGDAEYGLAEKAFGFRTDVFLTKSAPMTDLKRLAASTGGQTLTYPHDKRGVESEKQMLNTVLPLPTKVKQRTGDQVLEEAKSRHGIHD